MRLLYLDDYGVLCLTEFFGGNIPPYVMLSHTWGLDGCEVTYEDLLKGTAEKKAGYTKIRLCGEAVASYGLRYFWVDTCCIEKSNSTELQEAITSMFHWYHDAVHCYVYLSDVSISDDDLNSRSNQFPGESAFRGSRWFTRGWTLQELLAPASVEFFSKEGMRLGDKKSLEQQIHEITGIAVPALRGTPLSQFSVSERFKWAEKRQTTREEDWAYSLLGVFDISMPLIYGERREKAITRLRKEIDEASKLLAGLPSAEGAAFDSYADELDARCHPDTRTELLRQIREWAEDPIEKCIFWLNGMAGTGKSTISRTVAQSFADKGQLGASFFFKRGEGERGSALRFFTTVTTQLVRAVPGMLPFVKNAIDEEPDIATKSLQKQFEKLVLQPLLQIDCGRTHDFPLLLVVDALDECEKEGDIRNILRLLAQMQRLTTVRMQIFLTSRPELPIRLGFRKMAADAHQDVVLHDIPPTTIEHDISVFLRDELAKIRVEFNYLHHASSSLPSDWPGEGNIQNLTKIASPLFIFAATVCRFIGDERWDPEEQLTTVLEYQANSQASQLDRTYCPILDKLLLGLTTSQKERLIQEFHEVVGPIVLLAEPLSIKSLVSLLRIPKGIVERRLDPLHSVLSIPADLASPIRLLHLSFREFLLDSEKEGSSVFWVNERKTNKVLANRCLELLSAPGCLANNICQLDSPGTLRTEINPQSIDSCLPPDVKYACRYWVHHLKHSGEQIHEEDAVHVFLKKHLLHWLEALSLIGNISDSIGFIDTLLSLVDVSLDVILNHSIIVLNIRIHLLIQYLGK
jgi:Heterokaryon incompatibility protein (HET)/NACHT domain